MRPATGGAPRAAIVYNPVRVRLDRLREVVGAAERAHGWAASRWLPTSADDGGRAAAREAAAAQVHVVLVAAGDGTVRLVAEKLHGSGTPLALLPLGTGNLLARNLHLRLGDLQHSVETAFAGATRQIDVAFADLETAEGHRSRQLFLVMAGIGIDSAMAENTNLLAKKHLGWLAYVQPIARSVLANRQFRLHYRIDGSHVRSARAHTVIVGNCGTLTGNMLLLPDAEVDDGLLDVVMFRPKGGFGWARVGTRLTVQGAFRKSRLNRRLREVTPDLHALAYAQGRQFDVRLDSPLAVELDGDSIATIIRARITVETGALAVCIPARTP